MKKIFKNCSIGYEGKKQYPVAPEDGSKWKCNWLKCANGMGLAGNGWCSARGTWWKKNCKYFEEYKNGIPMAGQ